MAQFISFSLAGLGWPSNQNVCSSSPAIGIAPQVCDTASTPGIDAILRSNSRRAARTASGDAVIIGWGSVRPTVRTLRGLKPGRSEEHTSELQSQSNIVCRLLLE